MTDEKQFKPALIIVDFQEDFCPPVSLSLCSLRHMLCYLGEMVKWKSTKEPSRQELRL